MDGHSDDHEFVSLADMLREVIPDKRKLPAC